MSEQGKDNLVDAATKKLNPESSLDEISAIASIAKSRAEAAEANAIAQTMTKKLKLELYQSLSSVLVPIVSIVALAATIGMQAYQIRLTRLDQDRQLAIQRESKLNDEWNEFLKTLANQPTGYASDPSVAPRLRFFLEQPEFNRQAVAVARNVLGNTTDYVGFEELSHFVFGTVTRANLDQYISLYLERTRSEQSVRLACRNVSAQIDPKYGSEYEGLCSFHDDDEVVRLATGRPEGPKLIELREALTGLYEETNFMSQAIADALRKSSHSHVLVNLRGIRLRNCNMSGIDFSYVKLDGVILDAVNLTHARITPVGGWDDVDIRASNWWDAYKIDPSVLRVLIAHEYPYYPEQGTTQFDVSQHDYESDLTRLCRLYPGTCEAGRPFGDRPE